MKKANKNNKKRVLRFLLVPQAKKTKTMSEKHHQLLRLLSSLR